MKKLRILLTSVLAIVCALTFVACTNGGTNSGGRNTEPNEPLAGESNVLVAYFSWSGAHNTQTMAEYIAEYTDGELFRIYPQSPYTTNYNDVIDIAQEERNNNARPVLAEDITDEQLAAYDVIFVGYPVWWYDAPMIIYTFLEAHDFSDKTVITFATSGGSGISDSNLRGAIDANFVSGLCISNFSDGERSRERVENWITELGYHN